MTASDNVKAQLIRLLDDEVLSLDFIAAFAGDRDLTGADLSAIEETRGRRGRNLYSDIMFTLTHQHFPADHAERLWTRLIEHKYHMSAQLGRNIGITVAAVDYLANIDQQISAPTVISQTKLAMIAEIAVKDGLTGLYDATTAIHRLEQEIARARRYRQSVAVIMIDIDNFKGINDKHGHPMGDRVITSVARLLLELTRELDVCARYGGEEFMVVLPQTLAEDASAIAERIRQSVEETFNTGMRVTLSLGVAAYPAHADAAPGLIQRADEALYRAKSAGKNRVEAGREQAA